MKPLADYSHIRGFNYTASYARDDRDFWEHYRHDVVDRELGYAQRMSLNSARVFLPYVSYLRDREGFLAAVKDFVRTAWARGISTSPIVYFGRPFYPDFEEKEPEEGEPRLVRF